MTTPAPAPGTHASSLASVSYDASAPLNADVRAGLTATTLAQFLEERPRSGRPITLDVDATVGDAMEVRWRAQRSAALRRRDAMRGRFFLGFHGTRAAQVLARNRISSAPVLSASGAVAAPFYGFVDVPTVIAAFFKGASAPTRAKRGFGGETKEGRSLACVLAKAHARACICRLQESVSATRARARCQGCPGPVRR
jgi:hypothetical protein